MTSPTTLQELGDDYPSTAPIDAPPRGSDRAGQGGGLGGLTAGRYLLVDRGGGPEPVALTEPLTHIGRSPEAEVCLDEPTVSARHAIVIARPGGLRVLDEGSTNGMLVNGRRVDEAQLCDGDVIVLGRAVLTYRDLRG